MCTVIAYASQTGICRQEHVTLDLLSQVCQIGAIETTLTPSKETIVGPL